jgi:glutaredoxin
VNAAAAGFATASTPIDRVHRATVHLPEAGTTNLPEDGPMPDPTALPTVDQVTVFGADWCGDCRRTKGYLDRTGARYTWVDTRVDTAARAMLKAAGYHAIPVVLVPGGTVLVEPSNEQLAAAITAAATGTAVGDPA